MSFVWSICVRGPLWGKKKTNAKNSCHECWELCSNGVCPNKQCSDESLDAEMLPEQKCPNKQCDDESLDAEMLPE